MIFGRSETIVVRGEVEFLDVIFRGNETNNGSISEIVSISNRVVVNG
jgi:hypothetical protein